MPPSDSGIGRSPDTTQHGYSTSGRMLFGLRTDSAFAACGGIVWRRMATSGSNRAGRRGGRRKGRNALASWRIGRKSKARRRLSSGLGRAVRRDDHPRTAMAAMHHSRIELTMNYCTSPGLLVAELLMHRPLPPNRVAERPPARLSTPRPTRSWPP